VAQSVDAKRSEQGKTARMAGGLGQAHPNSIYTQATRNPKLMARIRLARQRMDADTLAKLSQLVRGGGPSMGW
jgi:hypothetical protein